MSSSSPPTNTSTTSSSNPPLSGSNIDALWLNATPNGDSSTWYDKSTQYWAKIDATVGGVLGGFGHLSGVDVKESAAFVKRVMPPRLAPPFGRALDCGAGVGRTARALLAPMCRTVDLLEQDAKFLAKARLDMPPAQAGEFHCQSLQAFLPSQQYHIVWIQWVSQLPHRSRSRRVSQALGARSRARRRHFCQGEHARQQG
jgi:hypothetical protein